MFNPPDAIRQRCVALATLTQTGKALLTTLNKTIWLFSSTRHVEVAEQYEQETRTWCTDARDALTDEERAVVDRLPATVVSPNWQGAWDMVMGRAPVVGRDSQNRYFILDVLTSLLNYLKAIRVEMTPPLPIPESLIRQFTERFRRMSPLTVDRLFADQGCLMEWWVFPRFPTDLQSLDRVLGWVDGIHLYRPERLLTMMERVYYSYHDLKRKPINPDDSFLRDLATCVPLPASGQQQANPQDHDLLPEFSAVGGEGWAYLTDEGLRAMRAIMQGHLSDLEQKKARLNPSAYPFELEEKRMLLVRQLVLIDQMLSVRTRSNSID